MSDNDIERHSLGEALPAEMTRVRKLVTIYRDPSLGGCGEFAARMMDASLDAAQKALAEGDVVAMIAAYHDLQGFTE